MDTDRWCIYDGPFDKDGELTECFLQVEILSFPALWLLISGAAWLCQQTFCGRSVVRAPHQVNSVKWPKQQRTQVILCIILAILKILQIVFFHSNMINGIMVTVGWIFAVGLLWRCVATFQPPSWVLSVFWFLTLIANTVSFRSIVVKIEAHAFKSTSAYVWLVFHFVYYGGILMLAFLGTFFRTYSRSYQLQEDEARKAEKDQNLFSTLWFFWVGPIMRKAFKNPLKEDDLWDLPERVGAASCATMFQQQWKAELESPRPKKSVVNALYRAFGSSFVIAGVMKAISDVLTFTTPVLISIILAGVQNLQTKGQTASGSPTLILCAVGLFASMVLQSMLIHQYLHRCFRLGMKARAALVAAIYSKAMRLSATSVREAGGKTVTLMSADAQKFIDCTSNLHLVWSAPFQIGMALTLLYFQLGPPIFAGFGFLIFMIPVNGVLSKKLAVASKKKTEINDLRIKLIVEALSIIKTIKLYAWEKIFLQRIEETRDREGQVQRSVATKQAVMNFFFYTTPALVSLVTFSVYSAQGGKMEASKIFVATALFTLLRYPLNLLPQCVGTMVEAKVAAGRISEFLQREEFNPGETLQYPSHGAARHAVRVTNGNFSWGKDDKFTLDHISVAIAPGSLVAIIGPSGSGKTSLLMALLGEMHRDSGEVSLKGDVAYMSQQAWLQNDTVKENILFGHAYDENKYQQIVNACGLEHDIKNFPKGDETEVSESGVNLSGGQKQRVSLARTAYMDRELYFFDDPLSAVDVRVGAHIFENVFSKSGVLSSKTRVFVAHSKQYLPFCDQIIMMDQGRISAFGTYDELVAQNHIEPVINQVTLEGQSSTGGKTQNRGSGRITVEEERATGNVSANVYIRYLKAMALWLACILLTWYFVSNVITLCGSFWLVSWVDTPGDHSLKYHLGFYVVIISTFALSVLIREIILGRAGVKAATKLHNNMLERVVAAPMSFFDANPVGRLTNRFAKDVGVIDSALPRILSGFLVTLVAVLGNIGTLAYTHLLFLVAILPLVFAFGSLQRFHLRASRDLQRIEGTTRSPIFSHFSESLSAITLIRTAGKREMFEESNLRRIDRNHRAYFASISANRWLGVHLDFIGAMVVLLTALFTTLDRTWIELGLAGVSLSFAVSLTLLLNTYSQMYNALESTIVSVERVLQYADLEREEPTHQDIYDRFEEPAFDWPHSGRVTFNDVQLRYTQGTECVLKGVSFEANPGEKLGICGRTGAGKSSTVLALFRVVELAGGHITIDGVDISKLKLHDLRSKIGIVPQDPVLFSGTIRYNLDPFNEFVDKDIWAALRLCDMDSYVRNLEGQLDAKIESGGGNLSIGQKQLLCLGRVILRKPRILVLDEATAAIDDDTDQKIQDAVREVFKNSTVITIAHRLNTIMDYDRIIMMEDGRVTKVGPPSSVITPM